MKRTLLIATLCFLAVPLAAQQASEPAAKTSEQTASKPGTSMEYAHLHVYRARRYMGSGLAPSIEVDEKKVARIGNGRRFTARLSPGTHSIFSDDKSSAITLDAKAGQDYFIRVDEEPGFMKGHGKLTLLMPEQGKPEFLKQKPIEPDRRLAPDMLEDDSETPTLKE